MEDLIKNTNEELDELSKLKLAVVGHVEWVTFMEVDKMPSPGIITHSKRIREEPAGGGAVAAVRMAALTRSSVHFFTSLGKDRLGEKSLSRLKSLGLNLNVAWRDKPTRRGISFIDRNGERAITVIGERLQPSSEDEIPWHTLKDFDGIFVTATDWKALRLCRKAKKVIATPRVKVQTIKRSGIVLDAIIGSAFDPDENKALNQVSSNSKLIIKTEGSKGGEVIPGKRYEAIKLNKPATDSYGCGDSFAAGVTVGLAAGWGINQSIKLAAKWGGRSALYFGPYPEIY